jgi:hypothetical protein
MLHKGITVGINLRVITLDNERCYTYDKLCTILVRSYVAATCERLRHAMQWKRGPRPEQSYVLVGPTC